MIIKTKFIGFEFPLKSLYFVASIFLVVIFNLFFLLFGFKTALLVPFFFLLIYLFITFRKFYIQYFILSLGIVRYLQWDYRIQIATIVSVLMIILFITFKDTDTFNNLKYPFYVKLILILLVTQVFTSSLISNFSSFKSVMYSFVFLIYILLSYVVFRSIKDLKSISKLIDLFILLIVFSAIIDLVEIILTGNLRSEGLMGFAIMDLSVFVLLIFIFRNYLFGKTSIQIHIFTFLILILIIFHQSRFAWLGFVLCLSYGLIIAIQYFPSVKEYFKRKAFTYIIISFLFLTFIILSGYNEIILSRISEINFNFFQGTPAEGQYLSNSLESRILIWITAFNAFIAQPFFGVGYFMFPLISEQYNVLPQVLYNAYVENLDAHTTYFNFLVETGIIGFVLFLSFVILMYRLSLKSIRLSLTDEEKIISIVLNIFCFFVMIHSIYSGAFTFGINAFHMWFMYALNISNYVLLKNNINLKEAYQSNSLN